ncbi:MAG TPA: MBL fold metallo-hydrolase [Dictyobacter sp.]|nr:MBL fold metallo-hydrolase [Dictyobacter sp.]
MEISWLGHSCFQLRGKNVTVITDPFTPQEDALTQEAATKLGKTNASIVTVSHNHSGHNYVQGLGGNPRVVNGPGEYEISEVLITGVPSFHDDKRGQLRGRNTIYVIHMDDLVICHLGDLGHSLQEDQLEEVADADVLLVPIGGSNSLTPTQAAEILSQVEPRIAIPMHYPSTSDGETSTALSKFCREMGIETIDPQSKLSVTKNSLPASTQVVILAPR